jgi:hypothetical protein
VTIALRSPATVFTVDPLDLQLINTMPKQLNGEITKAPNTVVRIKYPASIGFRSILTGVSALQAAIASTSGQKIVFGYSEGASVSSVWLRQHTSDGPPADELAFVLIGSPNRGTGFYKALRPNTTNPCLMTTPTDTRYTVYDIARRGDGWANWSNLAVWRAVFGMSVTHCNYRSVEMNAQGNSVRVVGNTTYVDTA